MKSRCGSCKREPLGNGLEGFPHRALYLTDGRRDLPETQYVIRRMRDERIFAGLPLYPHPGTCTQAGEPHLESPVAKHYINLRSWARRLDYYRSSLRCSAKRRRYLCYHLRPGACKRTIVKEYEIVRLRGLGIGSFLWVRLGDRRGLRLRNWRRGGVGRLGTWELGRFFRGEIGGLGGFVYRRRIRRRRW